MTIVEKPVGVPFDNGAKRSDGQYERYAVLPKEEREKGFIRPYRDTYRHVGPIGPKYPLRDLTEEEQKEHAKYGYAKFEPYPEKESPVIGRFWTQKQLDHKGCNTTTHMGYELSATYARQPSYYGSTFCCHCGQHFPVGEFIWEGTTELVGS